eukprot:6537532-Pyramimonas_sp.AAC.1
MSFDFCPIAPRGRGRRAICAQLEERCEGAPGGPCRRVCAPWWPPRGCPGCPCPSGRQSRGGCCPTTRGAPAASARPRRSL